MSRRPTFVFSVLLSAALAAQAPAPKQDLDARLRELAERCVQRSGASGLALSIRSADNETLRLELGALQPSAESTRPRVDTRALVEPLVAIAAWQRIDSGQWKPEQPMRLLAPELALGDFDATLAQFLAHTAGIASPLELAAAEPALLALPVPEYAARVAALSHTTAPGECFGYSDAHVYAIATALARQAAQRAQPTGAAAPTGGARALGFRTDGAQESQDARAAAALAVEPAHIDDARAWVAEHVIAAAGLDPELLAAADSTPRSFGWQRVGDADHESCAAHALGPLRFELAIDELARLGEALTTPRVLSADGWRGMVEPARERDGVSRRIGHGVTLVPLGGVPGYSMGGAVGETRVHLALYPEARLTLALALVGPGAERGDAAAEFERRAVRLLLGAQQPSTAPLPLPAELRATYVGIYSQGCASYRVVERDGQLEFAPPRGDALRLVHVGTHEFAAATDPEVRLRFTVVEGRPADELLLDNHGATSALRRLF